MLFPRVIALILPALIMLPSLRSQLLAEPMAAMSICGAPTLNIAFTAVGAFNAGNVFTVELSDALGSFVAPTVIGSAAATGSGSILCSFPAGIQGGSGQAIRVVASDPAEIGDAYVLPITTVVPPNAGLNIAVTLCSNSSPVQLISVLAGTPNANGTWSGPVGAVGGVFDASTDPQGTYQYVVDGDPPCLLATAALSIVVVPEPNAGTGGSLTVCSSDAPFSMFAQLTGTPQQGGAWVGPAGQVQNGIFLPSSSIPGCYTYVVAGSSPCSNANALLCIGVNQTADLGPDFSVAVCGSTPINMQAGLPPGGTWAFGGQPHSNIFTPGIDGQGPYVYTVPGVSPCSASSVTALVTVSAPPNAGANAAVSRCLSQGNVDLFNALGGSPATGGTWTDINSTGQLVGGTFVVAGVPSGTYPFTYTVAGGNCPDAQATVTVNLNATCILTPQAPYPVE